MSGRTFSIALLSFACRSPAPTHLLPPGEATSGMYVFHIGQGRFRDAMRICYKVYDRLDHCATVNCAAVNRDELSLVVPFAHDYGDLRPFVSLLLQTERTLNKPLTKLQQTRRRPTTAVDVPRLRKHDARAKSKILSRENPSISRCRATFEIQDAHYSGAIARIHPRCPDIHTLHILLTSERDVVSVSRDRARARTQLRC